MQDHDNNSSNEAISDSEMRKIAQLSMLNLPKAELDALKGDFGSILDLFTQLEEINVETVVVSYEANRLAMKPREDKVIHDTENNIDKIALSSPYINKKSGCFDVPPVIETE